ncbi:MAG: hypothetical protein ACLS6G_09965 [Christensenellales bacterium]
MRESAPAASRPDRRRRGGQRAREQLPPTTRTRDGATTPADGETAARRAATAQAGRHQDARASRPFPAISAERPIEPQKQRGRRRRERRARAQAGARPPDAANRRARHKLPCPAPRGAQGQADGRPDKPPGAKRTGATAQRANLAACAPLWRFFPLVVGSGAYFVEKTLERAKKRKKGA